MIGEQVRERLGALGRREVIGLAVVGGLIVSGAVFWYVRSLPAAIRVEGGGPVRAAPGTVAASSSPSASPAPVVVDVAGWVRHPGVYQLHQGDRVIDAIERAGGARRGADLTSINLAALLTDGEQILVGKAGSPGSMVGGASGISGGPGGGAGQVVNINTATLDQLESLPGIGPSLGQRIIDYRTQHGPFHSVDDLLNVSGIGDKRLADLRPLITV